MKQFIVAWVRDDTVVYETTTTAKSIWHVFSRGVLSLMPPAFDPPPDANGLLVYEYEPPKRPRLTLVSSRQGV